MLSNLHNYEEILAIQRTENPVREIIFPPSEKNLGIWWLMNHAAVEVGEMDFIEQYIPSILKVCNRKDEFDFLCVY